MSGNEFMLLGDHYVSKQDLKKMKRLVVRFVALFFLAAIVLLVCACIM